MPAKRPEYLPGHYYHFYNRGAHGISIFREDNNYLFVLRKMKEYCRCRYIHANPVKHGQVADLMEWPYSNYLEWIGERNGTLVDRDFVREHFASP